MGEAECGLLLAVTGSGGRAQQDLGKPSRSSGWCRYKIRLVVITRVHDSSSFSLCSPTIETFFVFLADRLTDRTDLSLLSSQSRRSAFSSSSSCVRDLEISVCTRSTHRSHRARVKILLADSPYSFFSLLPSTLILVTRIRGYGHETKERSRRQRESTPRVSTLSTTNVLTLQAKRVEATPFYTL